MVAGFRRIFRVAYYSVLCRNILPRGHDGGALAVALECFRDAGRDVVGTFCLSLKLLANQWRIAFVES